MEDRIEINGHWYVREDSLPQSETQIEEDMELTFSRTCTFEDDKRLFTFDVLENDNQELVMPSLSYCNKRIMDSETIHIGDNENWFLQLIERDKLAISQLDGEIDLESDREILIRFLTELHERNWI